MDLRPLRAALAEFSTAAIQITRSGLHHDKPDPQRSPSRQARPAAVSITTSPTRSGRESAQGTTADLIGPKAYCERKKKLGAFPATITKLSVLLISDNRKRVLAYGAREV